MLQIIFRLNDEINVEKYVPGKTTWRQPVSYNINTSVLPRRPQTQMNTYSSKSMLYSKKTKKRRVGKLVVDGIEPDKVNYQNKVFHTRKTRFLNKTFKSKEKPTGIHELKLHNRVETSVQKTLLLV